MSVYITKVNTNLKKVQEVELGEKTIIVGANGSGKSSILNSIELCFGGYVSDYRGRTVKNARDLHALSVDGNLTVQCTCSDGTKKSVSVNKKENGTVSRPLMYGKTELHLPLQNITSILEGSSKTFKTWLIEQMNIDLSQESLQDIATEHGVNLGNFSVDSIETSMRALKEEIKKGGDSIRSRKKTIEDFAQTINPNVDLTADDKHEKVKRERDFFQSNSDKWVRLMNEKRTLQAELATVKGERTIAQSQLDTLHQKRDLYPTQDEILENNVRQDVIGIFNLLEKLGQTKSCLICDGHISDFSKRKDTLDAESHSINIKVNHLTCIVELEMKVEQLNERCNYLQNKVKEIDAELPVASDLPKSQEVMDNLNSELNMLQQKMNDLTVYRLKLKEISRVKDELVKMEDNHKENKRLLSAYQQIQTDIIETAKDAFVVGLNQHISFDVGIQVGDKQVDIGKLDGERLCFGLSGAEYLELKFALVQYLYPSNTVLLTEDRAIDSNKLVDIMSSLSTFSGQVILTSVVPPSTIPQGWTLLELKR